MKCPQCQTDNKEGANFCLECGHKFELKCPQCGHSVPPTAKFCDDCGHQLSIPSKPTLKEISFDEKLRKIQKYLPRGLTEKVLSQRDKIEGERRQVTVMFADMQGFTPLVEKLGPEEAYAIMDQVYEILIHKVHDYEGTVNEMTGDGIMALFGAPIALEDAPQRAIRSALAIHREITRFSDHIKQGKGIPQIKMRIGIHTGPVVVGTLGNDLRVEFKAVGDTVNLASRREGLAEAGATFVTEDTFKLTEGFFRFEALGGKAIKGKEAQVKVYHVIAPSSRRTRFDVSAERGLTPFVGRERELELLLDGFERVKEGRGQAFSIMGEAGVGKSRLLFEFRKAITNEDVTFLEGKCLSYGRGMAYHPIIDILKSNFDIQEGDEDFAIQEKVKKGLGVLRIAETSTLPYFLELLSVKDSGIDQIPTSPEGKKDRTIESLKQIILKGSEIRPLIMAIEDLHWIDKSSEEALKYFLESIPGARVLLIFTYRPEFVHTWGGRSYHNQINLNRLSNRESLFMVAHLLGTHEVDRDLEKLILEKTEGIPFFIEELLKSLKDLKIIERTDGKYQLAKDVKAVAIPSTIQDMIMARVDSLPDATKTVLQTGSAIEREFTYDLIKRVTGLPEQPLLTHLSALKDSELLYERGIYPQTSYIFRHALTREVVYDSILTKKKSSLHQEIGKAIEEAYKNSLDEYYSVLAEHFIASGNYEKGADYSRLAGKKAEEAAALNDAIAHTYKRINCLEKRPHSSDLELNRIDARVTLGLYQVQMGFPKGAKEAIAPVFDLAIQRDYRKRLSQIYTIWGAFYVTEGEFEEAKESLEAALKLSADVQDIVTEVLANFWLGTTLGYSCNFENARTHFQRALDINLAANNKWGAASVKSHLALHCYYNQGNIGSLFETATEALKIADEIGDIYSKGFAHTSYGVACLCKGNHGEAEKYLLSGADLLARINLHSWEIIARLFLMRSYIEIGEPEKLNGHLERVSLLLAQDRIWPVWTGATKIMVAWGRIMNGEREIDIESLYIHWKNCKLKLFEGMIARNIGEILLKMDTQNISKAEDWIQKAIEADEKNGTRIELGINFASYSELFKQKGNRQKAREYLGKAMEIMKECGADGWVSKYEKELASIL